MSETERERPLLQASEERAYEETEKVLIVGIDEEEDADYGDELGGNSPKFSWKKLWLFTGPGFLMSIAFLDPGNLESDLQAGAIAGYSLIWLLMWATAIGLLIQLLSARLGVATGRHLAELCREEYPTWARMVLWIMAEIALIGADIQEVIGSAIAIKILSNGLVPLWAGVVITALDCFIFLFLENYGIRKLEAVFAILIATMALAFAWMFGQTKPSGTELLVGALVPKLSSRTIKQAVGIVGCIIMPHNVFLHSALVQSREVDPKKRFRVKEALKYYSIESTGALAVSFIINVFVTTVFAKSFYGTDIADTIGLANAGQYLQDKYGGGFFPILYIWAIGVLAAGQSSTITGTYAGQFIMGGFLNLKMKKWVRALITRSCAIIPTMIVALVFDSSDSMLDELNEWLNVLQSVQIPFAVIPLLCLVSNEQIMGSFKIQPLVQTISWIVAALVIAINGYLMVDFFSGAARSLVLLVPVIMFAVAYVMFVLYLISRGLTYTPWQLVASQKETQRDDDE
ncbi:PREDICTED: metal transporter Nramp4 [Camelina sativa]|uniref:Metal transporter Nramp4 n=1 Tax=Camelina sativa TaxID=90675 RepID=A0ABM0UQR4_CAMSA|nr:PREDICTED: metal transporter Nramp4 [Camelina sativa]